MRTTNPSPDADPSSDADAGPSAESGQPPHADPPLHTYLIEPPAQLRDPVRYARRIRWLYRLLAWGFPILLLLVWQLAAAREWIDTRLFPSPSEILDETRLLIEDGMLWSQVWISL